MVSTSRTRKSAVERKAEVVSAALELADQLGPDRVTTETLAESVGLTHPGLFRHFPKKLNVWEAVAGYVAEQMEKRWNRAERKGITAPEARLRGLVLAQLRLIRAFPAIPAILFSRELQVENDKLRKAFVALMQRFHARLSSNIVAAQKAGVYRDDFDPDDAAYLLISLVQGLAVRWSVSARRFNLLKEGERLLDLQLRGLHAA